MGIDWIGFIIASIAVVLAPGPGSLFVAKTATTSGMRAGFMAMLGIMVGDTCLIVLSLLGVSALFHAHPSLFHAIRLFGAGYLIFLGLQAMLTKSKKELGYAHGRNRSFMRAVSITLLNPKAVFFFMAFFPVFIKSPENGLLAAYAIMTPVFQIVSAAYLSALIRASSWVAVAFRQNHVLETVSRKLCGFVFIAFGLKAALASR
jgi:leucine efflux protein